IRNTMDVRAQICEVRREVGGVVRERIDLRLQPLEEVAVERAISRRETRGVWLELDAQGDDVIRSQRGSSERLIPLREELAHPGKGEQNQQRNDAHQGRRRRAESGEQRDTGGGPGARV